jgi:cobalamin biosynthesis Mg chelatase CobN
LVNNLRQEELTIFALAYNYDLYRRQPDNSSLRALLTDLFAELYVNHSIESLAYFSDTVLVYQSPESTATANPDTAKLDKEDQNSSYYKNKEEWKLHALAEVLSDTFFVALAEEGFAYGRERSEEIAYYDGTTREGRKNTQRANRRRKRRGRSLGVKKAIVINPVYLHLEQNGEGDVKINREISESQRRVAIAALESSAEMLEMDLTYLDANELSTEDAAKLNDIALAKQWISTQFDAEEFIYHAYDKAATDQLIEKYGTPYLINVVLVSGKSRKGRELLGKSSESLVFVMVFDLKTGRRSLVKSKFMSRYLTKTYMQSELYHALYQISKTR